MQVRTMQDEDNLRIALRRFGDITKITMDPKMRSATVFFYCEEAAEEALYFFETRRSDVITVTSFFVEYILHGEHDHVHSDNLCL